MTGKIRTLRVDKGFGFIKDEAERIFFHQSAVSGERIDDLREGDSVEFEVGQGPKGPRAKTCAARLRKRTESRRRPCVGLVCCGGDPARNGDELPAGTLPDRDH